MTIKWIGLIDDIQNVHGFQKLNIIANKRGAKLSWLRMDDKVFKELDNKIGTILFVAVDLDNRNLKLTKDITFRYPLVSIIILTDNDNYDVKAVLPN